MDRAEHLAWAKQRAMEYVERGELMNAIGSMLSDVGKHPALENHPAAMVVGLMVARGWLATRAEVSNWIEGFK